MLPVCEFDHDTVPAQPVASKVVLSPVHIVLFPVIATLGAVGMSFTITSISFELDEEQYAASIPLQVALYAVVLVGL